MKSALTFRPVYLPSSHTPFLISIMPAGIQRGLKTDTKVRVPAVSGVKKLRVQPSPSAGFQFETPGKLMSRQLPCTSFFAGNRFAVRLVFGRQGVPVVVGPVVDAISRVASKPQAPASPPLVVCR